MVLGKLKRAMEEYRAEFGIITTVVDRGVGGEDTKEGGGGGEELIEAEEADVEIEREAGAIEVVDGLLPQPLLATNDIMNNEQGTTAVQEEENDIRHATTAATTNATKASSSPSSQSEKQDEQHQTHQIKVIQLKSPTKQNSTRGYISWPTPKLVRKIHDESTSTLPCNIPTWRTHPCALSSSNILGGLDTIELIANVMNVAVLEGMLLQQQHRQQELMAGDGEEGGGGSDGNNNNNCGYIKESDVWGTSLDVYSHVNWKHLFAGFKRPCYFSSSSAAAATTATLGASTLANTSSSTTIRIDPNIILCPYELGGSCADGKCTYQHLKKRKRGGAADGDEYDADEEHGSMGQSSNGVYEGYVRYNNLSKIKLPRAFVRDDFILPSGMDDDDATDVKPANVDERPLQHHSMKQPFHCEVCNVRGHPKFEPRDTPRESELNMRDYNDGRDERISIANNNDVVESRGHPKFEPRDAPRESELNRNNLSYEQHLNGRKLLERGTSSNKTNVATTFHCQVCNVSCQTDVHFAQHMNGGRHKKQVARFKNKPHSPLLLGSVNDTQSTGFYCQVCCITSSSERDYQQHINGKKHKKRVARLGTAAAAVMGSAGSLPPPLLPNGKDDDATGVKGMDKKEEAVQNHINQQTEDQRRYQCPVCLIENNSQVMTAMYDQDELRAHMEQNHNHSSLAVNDGTSVTICHVLRNPEDSALGAVNTEAGSSGDDNNIDDDMDASVSMEENANDEQSMEDDQHLPHSGVEENLDYVSLPSVADDSSIDSATTDQEHFKRNDGNDKQGTIFSEIFWWQQVKSFPAHLPKDVVEHDGNNFDNLLLAFGFQRLVNDANDEGSSHSLGYITTESSVQKLDDIQLLSRLIDLSRILVHMGRDAVAISAMSSIRVTKDAYPLLCRPYWRAYESIQSLSHSRCALAIFHVQVYLLVTSQFFHLNYDSLIGHNNDGPYLDELLDQIQHLHNPENYTQKKLLPTGFDRLSQGLMGHVPSVSKVKEDEDDEWSYFVQKLRYMVEKFVTIPYSQVRRNEQLLLLLQSICIGKYLGFLMRNVSMERGFVSYLHMLEPIWNSLQPLLQVSLTGCKGGWLQPDLIILVLLGPVIFASVAETVAPPSNNNTTTQKEKKLPPKYDARAHANLSILDSFIKGIIKELSRFGRRDNRQRLVEPLMTPLYALSTTLDVMLGSLDKAHVRLEQVLNKEVGSQPSLYALSDILWSQLVQLRIMCPSVLAPLAMTTGNSTDVMLQQPLLPDDIIQTHREVASRIVNNGVLLWGVKLHGDSHMNIISPCFNQNHCLEWEKVATQIFKRHPLEVKASGDREIESPSSITAEFHISDPYSYPNLDGLEDQASVFPDTLLLLGTALSTLRLEKCKLTCLPLSIGYQLTNLKVCVPIIRH